MARLGDKTAWQGDMVWGERMTAGGVDFLESWIAMNVASETKIAEARALATRYRGGPEGALAEQALLRGRVG